MPASHPRAGPSPFLQIYGFIGALCRLDFTICLQSESGPEFRDEDRQIGGIGDGRGSDAVMSGESHCGMTRAANGQPSQL